MLSAATVLISAGNYGYSLSAVHLLNSAQFSGFAAGQSLLLIVANGSMAAIPWAVAYYISLENGPYARAEALRFGLIASALQAVFAAIVVEAALFKVSGVAVATVAASAAVFASLIAAPVGFLQGSERVDTLARLRLIEAVVRIGTGLVAVLVVSRSGALALVGFPAGGAVMFILGLLATRGVGPLRRSSPGATRFLVRQSLQLGAVQLLLCVLGALDTVEAGASGFSARVAGSYQAAALVGRLPLFISTAVAVAVYTQLTRAPTEDDAGEKVRHMLRFYGLLAFPVVLACLTIPTSLLQLLIPDRYSSAPALLRYTAISGICIGLVNCLTTAHQARGRARSAIVILALAAVAQPFLLVGLGRSLGVFAFAGGSVGLALVTVVATVWDARQWLTWPAPRLSPILLALGFCVAAAVVIREPVGWLVAMMATALCIGGLARTAPNNKAQASLTRTGGPLS